jgi:hypothetical protein
MVGEKQAEGGASTGSATGQKPEGGKRGKDTEAQKEKRRFSL